MSFHVRKHIAEWTGMCWFIVEDEHGCRLDDSPYFDTWADAKRAADIARIQELGIVPECLGGDCPYPERACPCSMPPDEVLADHARRTRTETT